ncbi:MAG: DEAD/DEAH box helicase [Candidatus Margulisiibacteriota bacterium]|jgi:non-specific serine/threonine protein kinase
MDLDTSLPTYYLVLNKEPEGYLSIKIFHDNVEINLGSKYLPPDLNNLVKNLITQESIEKNIFNYLTKNFYTYPIYLSLEQKLIKLCVSKHKVFKAKLELEQKNKTVIISRVAVDENEVKILGYFLLVENLAFNSDNGELIAIHDTNIWHLFNSYNNVEPTLIDTIEKKIVIPLDLYLKKPLIIKSENCQSIKFIDNNQFAKLIEIKPKYKIDFFIREDYVILNLFISTNYVNLLPNEKMFKYFGILRPNELSVFNKTNPKLLKEALIKIFMAVSKEKINLIIKNFTKQSQDNLEIVKFFNTYLERFQEKEILLMIEKNQWRFLEINHKKIARLYTSLFDFFDNSQIFFTDNYNELQVEKELFFSELSELQKKLALKKIELSYHQKRLLEGDLKLNLAIKQEKIDWFKIEPELFSNKSLLATGAFSKIIKNHGLLEEKDFIRFFSKEMIEKAQIIAQYFQDAGLKEKNGVNFISKFNIFHWLNLREKGIDLKLDKKTEAIMKSISKLKQLKNYELPELFTTILRDYQKTAYSWLAFLYEHKFGACLADDMGLGKTIEAIAFFVGLEQGLIKSEFTHLPNLIVVPPTLIFNWKNEFEKFYPQLKVFEYTGNKRSMDFSNQKIILTTYDIVRRDIEKISEYKFNVIVFDEAQFIKNLFANRSRAARKLNAEFKLCLTGTPIENNLLEYYSIIDLAMPGLFNNLKSFQNLIKENDLKTIIERSKPFVLRRTKQHILKDLPPKIETIKLFQLNDLQQRLYFDFIKSVKSMIDNAFQANPESKAQIIALTAILRLRQLCISPYLVNEKYADYSPKIEFLLNKLEELKINRNKAIIFSQFVKTIDILEKYFIQRGFAYLRLDGKTPLDQRKKIIKDFQSNGDPLFLIMSLKTGGLGLNLTSASYVFHMDPWWNPAVENQASDRAHRFGQSKTVFVNKLIMHGTIEEKMLALKERKINLYEAILDQGIYRPTANLLTREDFEYLLS